MTRNIALLLMAVVSATALAQTPANSPIRIRGTVQQIEGQTVTVKEKNGQNLQVKLADNYSVLGVARASIAVSGQPDHL